MYPFSICALSIVIYFQHSSRYFIKKIEVPIRVQLSLTVGLEYELEQWNRIWNGMNVYSYS